VREIVENSLARTVGAFQRVTEALFERVPGSRSIHCRKNVFQSIAEGSELWRVTIGKRYDDLLTPAEMVDLVRFFQQRHLLAHCEGIVDQEYTTKSVDQTYAVGQRLVVRVEAVRSRRATRLRSAQRARRWCARNRFCSPQMAGSAMFSRCRKKGAR